jgi:hypothetical protein
MCTRRVATSMTNSILWNAPSSQSTESVLRGILAGEVGLRPKVPSALGFHVTNADFHAANSTLLRTDLLLVSDRSAQVDGFGRYRATRHRWVISPSCHLRRACACWPVVGDLARKHDLSPFACLNAVAICCRTCAQRGGNDPITSAMKRLRSEIALRAGRDRLVVCVRSCTSGASHCPGSRVTVASTNDLQFWRLAPSYRGSGG